ncbi:MAG TPA: LanC-like protein [Caulobacteraceae bacterium]
MDALIDSARHEPLAQIAWDPGAARAAIERIVADARAAFSPKGLWPAHVNDARPGSPPLTMFYMGAAGVIWGLDYLTRVGAAPPGPSFSEHLDRIETSNHEMLAGQGAPTLSYLIGDAGVQLARWNTDKSPSVLESLAATIASNTEDPTLELMWGAPGTMLIALALHDETSEDRWADLFRAGAAALERAFEFDARIGAHVWTQNLYGRRKTYLGAVHGFAGNAFVLIKGRELLDAAAWSRWSTRLAGTMAASALRGGAGVNWPPAVGASGDPPPVQHCHGAPGMVTCLAALDEPIDDLLVGAGELTWRAGPLNKGANLCHGTAGNGYAFLKLFERTGDGQWLDRARAFAMHAIAQSDAEASALGQRRYSLWTGDIGVAAYLWDCLEGRARFPSLDVL